LGFRQAGQTCNATPKRALIQINFWFRIESRLEIKNYSEKTMFKRILIPTDGSELSQKAADSGIQLAKLAGGQIVALQVVPRYPVSYFEGGASISGLEIERIEQEWADAGLATVAKVKAQAEAQGVSATAVISHSDMIAEAIIETAKKHECDLIVMASHGRRGLTRLLLGSETTHVLTHSVIPVMVLR
jgi:nucleotide-binding universal stress UspA family protein